jgi:hypothetical protein
LRVALESAVGWNSPHSESGRQIPLTIASYRPVGIRILILPVGGSDGEVEEEEKVREAEAGETQVVLA